MRMKQLPVAMIALTLTACTVGPNYVQTPPVLMPTHYKEAQGKKVMGNQVKWTRGNPQEFIDRGEWWKIFNEPKLNALEDQLNLVNQNIVNAQANFRQSLALVDQARASWFPTLTAAWTVMRQKSGGGSAAVVSGTSAGTASAVGPGVTQAAIFNTHSLLLNAAWEVDIWGSVRRAVEASVYGAQASDALLAATRLSAQASLAQYYFELRSVDLDQKILEDTVKGYKRSLRLATNQYRAGIVSRADVVQAQSLVEAAEAEAINNKIFRAQYEHAIAVLIGVPPADFSLAFNPLNRQPPPIPLQVPSALLERRPDVAQAERLVAQSCAQIGVAISAYFPSLTLTGSGTSTGQTLAFTIPNFNWALAAQLAGTILDGGYRSAVVAAARAQFDANVATYRQTLLTAFQDVEDNLAALRILRKEFIVQMKAVKSADRALKIILNQYRSGIVPYANVIIAQIQDYTAQKNAADIAGLQMTTAVGLVKALGGGWNLQDIYDWCQLSPRCLPPKT